MIKYICLLGLIILSSSMTVNSVFEKAKEGLAIVEDLKLDYELIRDLIHDIAKSMKDTAHLHEKKYHIYHFLDAVEKLGDERACNTCKTIMGQLQNNAASPLAYDILSPLIIGVCTIEIGVDPILCQQAVATFGEIVLKSAGGRAFNPDRACHHLLLCKKDWERETIKQYIDMVLADKPNATSPIPTLRSTYKAMHVTDLHVDLFYEAGTDSMCDYIVCCRNMSGPAPNASASAGWWATVDSGTCDIPMRTVDQLLQFVQRTFDIDMVIWTGDNIAHDIFYQSAFNQTLQTFLLTQNFEKWLLKKDPKIRMFPIHGNHEGSPVNIFDYIDNTTAWLPEELATIWSSWLSPEAIAQLNATGFYAEYDPKKKLRVIAIDTNACNQQNFFLIQNPTDPYGELEFLREQLYMAERNNESVFIIGHIPTMNKNCDYQWSVRYNALIERFSHVIRANFFGHTHVDTFSIYRSLTTDAPVGIEFTAPSVTTRSYLHPSFRIYEIDTDTNVIVDYHQYHLNATKWNSNKTGPIDFDLFYSFKEEYNVPDLSWNTLDQLADEFLENPDLMALYQYNINTGYWGMFELSDNSAMHNYCECKEGNILGVVLCLGPEYATVGDIQSDILEDDGNGIWLKFDN